MTDARLAESFLTHKTVDELSDAAFRVYVNGLVYSVAQGTDGFVTPRSVRLLHPLGQVQTAAAELIRAGLWSPEDGGWRIRNFLRYQTSADQVEKARDLARLRKQRERRSKLEANLKKAQDNEDASPSRVTSPVTGGVTNAVGLLGQDSDSERQSVKAADDSWAGIPVRAPGSPSLRAVGDER